MAYRCFGWSCSITEKGPSTASFATGSKMPLQYSTTSSRRQLSEQTRWAGRPMKDFRNRTDPGARLIGLHPNWLIAGECFALLEVNPLLGPNGASEWVWQAGASRI